MKQTLSHLWQGNIRPIEEVAENEGEERANRAVVEAYFDKLWGKLDDEGKNLLVELKDSYTRLSFLENEASFIQGFSLATKMINEALSD